MEMIVRDAFQLCGFSVETTLEQNDGDVSALYADFFEGGKSAAFENLTGIRKGYYGLIWYTEGHGKYRYLLGVEAGAGDETPNGSELKEIPAAVYAVARYPQGANVTQAWYAFFYHDIPEAGCRIDEERNLYFEYYPSAVDGAFELWVPVIKEKKPV